MPATEVNLALYDVRGRLIFERSVPVNGNLASIALSRTIKNQVVILQVKANSGDKFMQKFLIR
jgi:hypothetical protein